MRSDSNYSYSPLDTPGVSGALTEGTSPARNLLVLGLLVTSVCLLVPVQVNLWPCCYCLVTVLAIHHQCQVSNNS